MNLSLPSLVQCLTSSGRLFIKRQDVLPTNLGANIIASGSRVIVCYNKDRVALKFKRHFDSAAARCLSIFGANRTVLHIISRHQVFDTSCSKTPVRLVNRGLKEIQSDLPLIAVTLHLSESAWIWFKTYTWVLNYPNVNHNLYLSDRKCCCPNP